MTPHTSSPNWNDNSVFSLFFIHFFIFLFIIFHFFIFSCISFFSFFTLFIFSLFSLFFIIFHLFFTFSFFIFFYIFLIFYIFTFFPSETSLFSTKFLISSTILGERRRRRRMRRKEEGADRNWHGLRGSPHYWQEHFAEVILNINFSKLFFSSEVGSLGNPFEEPDGRIGKSLGRS